MEFRILGPLEVAIGDRAPAAPPRAERALLARLLLDPGRVLSADTLIDALWRDAPPVNAANALQGRVSKLRRALTTMGAPDTLIATRRPGYAIQVAPDQVDAHRFTRLIAEARRLADTDPAAASRRYREALALWRGPALAEFSGEDWARPEIGRLEELRMAATEERIECELAAGRHADVVGDLEALVAEHPLREKLHAQLMLALYRSGRQADALAAYQRTRATLGDELGLDPSTELRDLERAILRQDPQLAAPTRTAATAAGNVPAPLTTLIGRESELAQVADLIGEHRLVTLTGPGGVGKTTLAVAAAARLAGTGTDGVWLVKLAGVDHPRAVPGVVADTLGAPAGTILSDEQLARYLRGRAALIVLDNCEHLVDACASLAEQLLTSCPQLRLLATSREPLAVPGEVQLPVPPLDIPPDDAPPGEVIAYDAVRLFLDRARHALPGFRVDADHTRHVASICRHLDGIPLAIELAAARVKTLPVSEIAARLDDRFRLLTGGPRTADTRQQTLRATVEWSHHLLTEPERVLFRRLAVFRGGWTVQAAEQVCAGGPIDRPEILDLLTRLVDRSLVVAEPGEQGRFRLLETIRHYAEERLTDAGEHQAVAAAHAAYFTATAEHGEPELRGPDQGRWLRWLRAERDNLRAAWQWARDHAAAHPDLGLRLAAALGWFWYFASRHDAGRDIAAMLAAAHDPSPAVRARALQAQALAGRPGACVVHPNPACAAAARASLDIFTELGDAHAAAYSQAFLAVEGISGSDVPAALQLLAEAANQFHRDNDRWGQALIQFVRMELHFTLGAFDQATAYGEQALSIFRSLGDHWGISAIQYHLGMALHRAGRLDAALDMYHGALTEGRKVGLANTVQYALANTGHVKLLLGDPAGAARDFADAHHVARELGADGNPLACLGEAALARQRGELDAARQHYEQALRLLTEQPKPDWTAAALSGLGYVAELTGDLDAAQSYHHQALCTATDASAAPATAVALEGLACVAAARGDGNAAANLLRTAAKTRDQRHAPPSILDKHDIDRATARTRALLGPKPHQTAFSAHQPQPDDAHPDS